MNKAYTKERAMAFLKNFMAQKGQDNPEQMIHGENMDIFIINMNNSVITVQLNSKESVVWSQLGEFKNEEQPELYRKLLEINEKLKEFSLSKKDEMLICSKRMDSNWLSDAYFAELIYLLDSLQQEVKAELLK
jgi:hypothetical protein